MGKVNLHSERTKQWRAPNEWDTSKTLESQFGEEYGLFLKLMGAIRKKLLSTSHKPEAHKPLFEQLIAADLIAMIHKGKTAEIDALLFEILGEGYNFRELMRS